MKNNDKDIALDRVLSEFLAKDGNANLFYESYTKPAESERRIALRVFAKALIKWMESKKAKYVIIDEEIPFTKIDFPLQRRR